MREFDFTPRLISKFTFEDMYTYFLNVASRYEPGQYHKKLLTNVFFWSESPIFKLDEKDWMYFYDTTAELVPSNKGDRYLFEVSVMLDNPLFFMNQCVPAEDAVWSGMQVYHGLRRSGYIIDAVVATSTEVMRYASAWYDPMKHSRVLAPIEPNKIIVDVSLIGKVKQSSTHTPLRDERKLGISNTFMPRQA